MAAGGLKGCEVGLSQNNLKIDKTRRMVELAFDMKDFTEQQTWGEGNRMIIKIGIHYGRVIAGVIGSHKP